MKGRTEGIEKERTGWTDRIRRALTARRRPRSAPGPRSLQARIESAEDVVRRAGPAVAAHVATDDHFGDVVGVPDVHRSEATAADIAAGLAFHGAVVVRGLLDHVSVQRLLPFASPDTVQVNPLTRSPDCEPMLDAFAEVYRSQGVLDLVGSYLGEHPVALSHRVVVSRRPRENKGLRWHQDAPFFGGRCHALNTWIALSPCDEDRPGLDIVPRGVGMVVDPDNTTLHPTDALLAEVEELTRTTPIDRPDLAPGDAILLDELTLHRSGWSEEPSFRYAAITWFFAPSRFRSECGTPLAF